MEIVLKDNMSTFNDLLVFDIKLYKTIYINYSIKRNELVEAGQIYLSYNPITKVKKINVFANFDETGISFCADINGDFLRLRYSSTNIGSNAIFKYEVVKFVL
jgi:hypothetical protein